MTSKEQEYEMRAQALKRLAFVVLSSQLDQYCTNLRDIQGKFTVNFLVCTLVSRNVFFVFFRKANRQSQAKPSAAGALASFRVLSRFAFANAAEQPLGAVAGDGDRARASSPPCKQPRYDD